MGTRLYAPVVVAATTGLRRGELLALRWSDVNLDAANLTVKRALEETKGGLNFKSPKTKKAQRILDLLPLTVEVLRRHRVDQAKVRLAAGPAWEDNDLVFPDVDGRPWRPSLLTGAFSDRQPGIRFHDLRHSHATQLLRAGAHPKIVSERLGHAGVGITLDTYSHVLPGMQKQAVLQLEASLRAAGSGDI
jgi:integrase